MANENEEIHDYAIRYAVFLERYKRGTVSRIEKLVTELNIETVERIERLLKSLSQADLRRIAQGGPNSTERLKHLRRQFVAIEKAARDKLENEVLTEAAALGADKARRSQRRLARLGVDTAIPAVSTLAAAVRTRPFQGRLLREYTKDWSTNRNRRMTQAIRVGLGQGDSIEDIGRIIRGTRSRGYRDGILNTSRNGAATLARTAVNHVNSFADREFARKNSEVIPYIIWTSTLDSFTSEICRVNDGRRFKSTSANEGLIPAHLNCRSFWTYELAGGGRSPANENYYDWLQRQPVGRVQEALGVERGQAFKEGLIDRKDLVNEATRSEYTLTELKGRLDVFETD